jgi:mannose-6-phosphate isomerase-like protein (cupin superfamily)
MKLQDCKVVKKDWGKEIWIEHENEFYAYKRIYINSGYRTSLQYHNFKFETNYIISGKARVFIQDTWYEMGEDEFFTIRPGVLHRVEAITNVILQEVSTPHLDDVIRVEDDYNRPNGKIEKEHE